MADFKETLESAVVESFCRVTAPNTQLLRTFADAFGSNPGLTVPAYVGEVAYSLVCDKRPDPPLPPPFSGGQCQTLYQVTSQATLELTAPPSQETVQRTDVLPGAIYGIAQKLEGSSDIIYITHRATDGSLGVFNVFGTTRPAGKWTSYQIISVVRVDGQPDDCGNPSSFPRLPPPQPGEMSDNTTINWTDINGDTITNNLNINIGSAYIDVQANVQIPIEVNIDARATINATINVSTGGISITPPGGSLPTGKPGSPGGGTGSGTGVDTAPPSSPIPDPPDPPDPTKSIVGAIVTVISDSKGRATQIIQKDNPDIYAPNLGFIQFLVRIGNGTTTAWTSDIPVKNVRNLIPCPWEFGAIDVRGTPQPGVEFDITPVYESTTEPPQFFT